MYGLISVFLGGAIGASLRYLTGLVIVKTIGLAYFYAITLKFEIPSNLKLFLMVGFLGGLTTFSSFSLENFVFLKDGKFIHFISYTLLSVTIGLIATSIGYYLFSNK